MALFEIKSWIDGSVLFALKCGSFKACVEAAVTDGASLDGARLDRASLDGARLDGASLDGARLDRASLVGASLVGASLDRARLVGASLDRASLDGARLVGARDIIQIGQPNGWGAYAYRAGDTIRVQVGCRNKTLPDGRAYWADKPYRREVLAAVDYAEAVAKIRGWEVAP